MTKKKSKKKGRKLTSRQLQNEVFRLFKRNPKKRFNPRQVAKKLKVDNNQDTIQYAIQQLVEKGKLLALEDFKFQIKKQTPYRRDRQSAIGKIDMTRTGAGYVICKDFEHDVYVPAKYMNSALHGDKVRLSVWTPRGRKKMEGEVLEVLERASEQFMGSIMIHRQHGIVVPDKLNMPFNIFVEEKDLMGALDGEKVIVKVTKWHPKTPKGEVTYVLGKAGGSDMEMKSILINNGFNLAFPEEVLAETNEFSEQISLQEVHRRRDMREVTTFTIDPADAKDFDDALSIRYLEDGNCEIGVHIADVTHYVLPGSALDKEALQRSTSVYLVDRVLPMLPEKLSNGLCSLRPNEDKCTFSAVFTFDKNDKIIERWFGKTLIHSNRRFAYEEAQEVINQGEGDFATELKALNRLAKKLRKDRFRKGSIDFDTEEVRFRLDENGVPIEVYVKERKEAHLLIEDFMLLANREVATFIDRKAEGLEIPFVYRIHDEPDPDKVIELARFAKEMGIEMNVSSPQEIGRSFNRLTKAAKKDPGLQLLAPLAIRTMAKAEYSPDNIGHYGLGFSHYAHFTSPIRRYADVLVHRLLEGNLGDKTFRTKKERLQEQCQHISAMERRAMDAERESIKYKQVEFIEKHVGEVFEGYISGMIDRGIFVELAGNKCEGMVAFESMEEPFEISNGRLSAKGIYTAKVLKMGDKIQVRIIATDLARRRIEMELA